MIGALDLQVAVLELPLVVGLQQHGSNQALDRVGVGEDAHHEGAPFDLLVQAIQQKNAATRSNVETA